MKTVWTSGLSEAKKTSIKEAYSRAGLVRDRLSTILSDKMDAEVKGRISSKDYDAPNWAYRQADSAGYLRALQEVISLIS